MTITIATRESRLAMWQATFVQSKIQALSERHTVTLLGMTTKGDQILDRSLSKIGGKGLFVKELETALLDGRADLAVHSLKDVPFDLPAELLLTAVMTREDPRDAMVSNHFDRLADLPDQAVVGTSSLRRAAQLQYRFPHLIIKPLRGNLDTRLGKLDEGQFDAIILASAGLKRLGLGDRIKELIDVQDMLPSPGQGALGIEIASHRIDLIALLEPLTDQNTLCCVLAERVVSRALGGSCQTPIAAYATIVDGEMTLYARLSLPNGQNMLLATAHGQPEQHEALGRDVVAQLMAQGGRGILDQLSAWPSE